MEECTVCKDDKYALKRPEDTGDFCADECPDGGFPNENTKECEYCHPSCASCSGPLSTDCLSCEADIDSFAADGNLEYFPLYFIQQAGICHTMCPSGQYMKDDPVTKTGVCSKCDPACVHCMGPSATDCMDPFDVDAVADSFPDVDQISEAVWTESADPMW